MATQAREQEVQLELEVKLEELRPLSEPPPSQHITRAIAAVVGGQQESAQTWAREHHEHKVQEADLLQAETHKAKQDEAEKLEAEKPRAKKPKSEYFF